MTPFLLLLSALSVARAGCKKPASNEDLHRLVLAGEQAYTYHQLAPLNRARADVKASVPCLEEVAAPLEVAAFYRLEGLYLYTDGTQEDVPEVLRYFQAACLLDPAYHFPEKMAPEGTDPPEWLETACGRPPFATLPLPESRFQVFIDGHAVTTFPLARPMVLQLMSPNGRITWTGILIAEDESDLPHALTQQGRRDAARGMALTGAGLTVVAGGLLAGSLVNKGTYEDYVLAINSAKSLPADQEDAVNDARDRANSLWIAAEAAGGLGLGLGLTAAVVMPW